MNGRRIPTLNFQRDLKEGRRNGFRKRRPLAGVWFVSLVALFGILTYTGSWIFAHLEVGGHAPEKKVRQERRAPERISRDQLPQLLADLDIWGRPASRNHTIKGNGTILNVETSLLPPLQDYMQELLRRSLTVRAAAVVMKPATGEVLAISDYTLGRERGDGSLSLRADHPAASLFKIVAAAAAIDARGFTPDSPMVFKGGKYTLYRSQLKPEKKPSGVPISLTKAFSASINPVFGRLGIYSLGYSLITEYADRFLFNRPIPFDLALAVSPMEVPTDDFALAEVASGYNKRTFISPVHAAMLAGAVANRGAMMGPRLIRKIEDGDGNLVYSSRPVGLAKPFSGETAKKMKVLMDETVVTGTCRSAFSKHLRKSSFKELELGAKTGSINDPSDQRRVDWVTAYAIPQNGEESAICVSVLAVHGDKIGIKAKEIARYLVEKYFGS